MLRLDRRTHPDAGTPARRAMGCPVKPGKDGVGHLDELLMEEVTIVESQYPVDRVADTGHQSSVTSYRLEASPKCSTWGVNAKARSRGNIGRAAMVWPRVSTRALVDPGASTDTVTAAQSS